MGEDEYSKVSKKSEYRGVSYRKETSKWRACRRSKNDNKMVWYGYYDDEETAARASDTLARTLMQNGKQNLKLNFPDDRTEVYWEKETTSKFIGVSYHKKKLKWCAQRWNKNENKLVHNGCYDDEEKAAQASDLLARKLMENGEQ